MSTDDAAQPPDIPERSWTNPFPEGHPLHDLFGRRVRGEQDLVILVDDYHARRGTGKTIASLQLAEGMDQCGGLTWENVGMRIEEIRNAYYQLPERSAIVLDEGEVGASHRDSMTVTNKALNEIMSMGRVEQKYVVVNTPNIGFIDKSIRKLADVWLCMLRKGEGMIHYLERNPYGSGLSGKTLTRKTGMIEFRDVAPNTRLREVYNRLTREKRKHIRGEEGNGFVPESEHQEALEKQRERVRQETRNEVLRDVYRRCANVDDDDVQKMQRYDGLTKTMIGEAVGLDQSQISRIVNQ